MNLEITRHAKMRMERRGVTMDDVRNVIDNHFMTLPGDNGSTVYHGRVRDVEVICVVGIVKTGDSSTLVIKTAWKREQP